MKPKVASPLSLLSTFLFFLFFISRQLTSHLQLHKALGTTFISLITCVCQLHICPFAKLLSLSFTHIRAVGLWFWGSYDTIQILLAAYSREMCFVRNYFPPKSRFSLPCSFDPHGTGGLCQQFCVSAGGPGGPPRCHSLLSVIAEAAQPLWGAVTHSSLNSPIKTANITRTQTDNHTEAHSHWQQNHLANRKLYGWWYEVRKY